MSEFSRRVRCALTPPSLLDGHDGLEGHARLLATAAVAVGTFMAVLDSTVANVALPTLSRELHAAPALSIWIVNAFGLTLVALLLPLASLGDIVGYERVYATGLAVFTLGSLACASAPNFELLVAARVLQGCGAAGILSIGPALYRSIFPRALLGRGIGISAMVVAVSSAAGPAIGGAILHFAPWPWLFAVNVPIGIANVALARAALPRTQRRSHRFDLPGAMLNGAGLLSIVLGFQGFARHVPVVQNLALATLGIGLLFLFARYQIRVATPLVAPDLFRIRRFALAAATSLVSFTGQGIAFVSLPFFLRESLHLSTLATGALLSTWPLTIALVAPIAGRLSDRFAPSILATIGLGTLASGFVLVSLLGVDSSLPHIVACNMVCGFGFGFFQSPNNREMLGTVPRAQAGSASGVLATVRVLGQTFGAATAAITLSVVNATSSKAAYAAAFQGALHIAATISLVAMLVSMTRLRVDASP